MQSACVLLYCHLWRVQLYSIFPHYLINGTKFGKIVHTKCVFWLSVQAFEYLPISEEFSEILSQMYIDFHVKYPLFVPYFNHNWIFSKGFRETFKYQISWTSRFRVILCWQTDRQTMMEIIVAYNIHGENKSCKIAVYTQIYLCANSYTFRHI